jgi:iron complex transport system substrate-binding protein
MSRKFSKLCSIYLVSAMVLIFLVACASPTESAPPAPIQLTDQLGRVVRLNQPPQRIISLAPGNTEILFALGLADKVVAVTDFDNYPPEVKGKPSIGGFTTPNIEKVVALSPDLVLATSIHEKTIIPQLEQRGLTVLALAPKTLDDVLALIKLVGQVTGQEKEATELLAAMQSRIKAVTDKVNNIPEAEKAAVFYLTWHDPLMTSGVGTLHNELIQKAGGRNIFPEVIGTKSVDLESIVARNPQIMIAGVGMGSGEDKTYQYLKIEPRLQNTEASKNSRIYQINMDLTGRAGPRIVDGLEQFARCIHPEIFGPPGNN